MNFKKCSNFHKCILRGFDFIETVYELFDNLSYNLFMKSDIFFELQLDMNMQLFM